MKEYTFLITTKNRLEELKITLSYIRHLLERDDVSCLICDDCSGDGTFDWVSKNYCDIQLFRNERSQGLIYSRNFLLNKTKSKYAISLDDDSHFVTKEPLNLISTFFKHNPNCGVIACSIFWSKENPINTIVYETVERVHGFVGCGHVWNMNAWKAIPNYPAWFVFYGEEDFAAFQLLKKGWEVYYVPEILIQHRVIIKERKKDKDYQLRLRRSLRSGWYLYFLFYPWSKIPRRFAYTLWIQFKNKVLKGDWKATIAIIQAMGDVLINVPRLLKESNRLSNQEFLYYSRLPGTKLYWMPKESKH